jgi:DNA-nicking Smr family endonuclease
MSAEDEALWRAVTETIKPLERRPPPGRKPMPVAPVEQPISAAPSPRAKPETPAPRRPSTAIPRAPKPSEPPPFEVKRARRLRRGKLEIDARIDLHGMRQAEAHRALRSFLLSSHARGLRHVKVITGKGRSTDEGARPFDLHGADKPGVLKRLVPTWLTEADLAAVVVSFTGAGRQHGGDGALYVHLRRRKSA